MRFWITLLLIVASMLLTACTFGNGRICGPQTPAANCNKEAYEKLVHPKAYGEYWVKPDTSNETRGRDSIACGGSTRGPDFTSEQTEAARQPGDKNDFAADTRLSIVWVNCMKEKGYRYVP